jgi:hypothetical protein
MQEIIETSLQEKSFDSFLQNNLSYHDYTHLPDLLKESRKATTLLLRDPMRGTLGQLILIVRLLKKINPSIHHRDILQKYAFGKNAIKKQEIEIINHLN